MRSILIASVVSLAACERPAEPASQSPAAPDTSAGAAVVAASAPATPITIDRGDGLVVTVQRAGQGEEITSSSAVTLHYRAFVENAEKPFDSSYESGVPLALQLGSQGKPRVIEGLARGLIGLRAGTQAKLAIPAALGWGGAGNEGAGVPKDAGLIYEVDVVGVH